jgi:serine O-acetyltransferase
MRTPSGEGTVQHDVPGLRALLLEDWRRHGCTAGSAAFRALAVQRLGVWRKRVRPRLLGKALRPAYTLLRRRMQNRYGIELHYTGSIGRRVRLSDLGDIVIGNPVVVGDDCRISQGVTLGRSGPGKWPRLGNRVVVGPGAAVIGAISVGDDVVIGPNAVVMTNLPRGAVVHARESRVAAPDPEASSHPASVPSPAAAAAPGPSEAERPLPRLLQEDRRAHGGRWLHPGFHAVASHRLARRLEEGANRPVRSFLARALRMLVRNVHRIEIAPSARLGRSVRLSGRGRIRVGPGSVVGSGTVIDEGTVVGWTPEGSAPSRIGRGARVGAGAVVTGGGTVGDGAVVRPGAVVLGEVPPHAVLHPPEAKIMRPLRRAGPAATPGPGASDEASQETPRPAHAHG